MCNLITTPYYYYKTTTITTTTTTTTVRAAVRAWSGGLMDFLCQLVIYLLGAGADLCVSYMSESKTSCSTAVAKIFDAPPGDQLCGHDL